MRRRAIIFAFNVVLAVSVSTLYAWVLSGAELKVAFLGSWWAGFVVGATVGAGAVLGPRPPLSVVKSAVAQAMVVATSALGSWIGSFFPGEIEEAEKAVHGFLENRGIILGTGIGVVVGTVLSIIDVYRQRRRAARRAAREKR